jgi:hypothetical protein
MQNESQNFGHLLPEEGSSDPYQVIADFFDLCDAFHHREHICTWLEAANKDDYWRDSCPSELLFYYEKMVNLIKAAHRIDKEHKAGKTAIDLLKEKGYDLETNLLHPALYFGWGRNETIWDCFPRNLSLEEYIDPYLVLHRFFEIYSVDEWHQQLYELLSDGLSDTDPAESRDNRDILLIQKNLLKLVEALHLIDVREVSYIGEFKKRYSFTLDRPCDDLFATEILRIALNRRRKRLKPVEDSDQDSDDGEKYDRNDEYHEDSDNAEGGDTEYNKNDDAHDDREDEAENGDDNDGNSDTREDGHDDILNKKPESSPKNIRIIIRGNYIVNNPPSS